MLATKTHSYFAAVFALLLMMAWTPSHADTPYTVTNGNELDIQSYQGYKVFRNWCARCHGTYGQGMRAPNLAESIAVISKAEYLKVMMSGKVSAKAKEMGRMPGWKGNAQVMDNLDNIYSYLKARADGKLGAVAPQSVN